MMTVTVDPDLHHAHEVVVARRPDHDDVGIAGRTRRNPDDLTDADTIKYSVGSSIASSSTVMRTSVLVCPSAMSIIRSDVAVDVLVPSVTL